MPDWWVLLFCFILGEVSVVLYLNWRDRDRR